MAEQGSCDTCVNFVYDEDYEYYVCDMDLDEDDMVRFLTGNTNSCPYYQLYDEYKIEPVTSLTNAFVGIFEGVGLFLFIRRSGKAIWTWPPGGKQSGGVIFYMLLYAVAHAKIAAGILCFVIKRDGK